MEEPPSGDPFESPRAPTDTAAKRSGASPLREAFVAQAVKFLSDPRVQAADLRRAVDFLRSKNLTEAEVRAAFDRVSLPFPETTARDELGAYGHGATPPNVVMLPPGAQLHVGPPRSTWGSFVWNIVVAAGVFAALREVVRRYVVPMYFPDLSAEERRRRESEQISELRDTVRQLASTTQETSERVERMSVTLSSSGALDTVKGGKQKPREPIGRASRSIVAYGGNASSNGGSDRSRGVLERLDELREEVNSLKVLSSGQKAGAEAVSASLGSSRENVDEFYTPQQIPRAIGGAHQGRLSFGGSSGKSRRSVSFGDAEEKRGDASNDSGDDFMKMEPASVEKSWASGSDVRAPSENGTDAAPETAEAAGVANAETANGEASANSSGASPAGATDADTTGDGTAATEATSGGDGSSSVERDTALRRFRETMLAEAELVASGAGAESYADAAVGMEFGLGDFDGSVSKRLSTASAPAPDTALSDVD
jgi:peroxin-14